MQGYQRDTTVSVDEARRVILTSFAAIDGCHVKHKLRSGNFYYYSADGEIVLAEKFDAPLDDATKLRLIGKLKPGTKVMLDEMHYGDENKLAPRISLTLVKGSSYAISTK